MSSSSTHRFPAPVGGAPLPRDFAPSILFTVLYGSLIPVILYRVANRRSRNGVLVGTVLFAIERVVAFALRAHASRNSSTRLNADLEAYFQATWGAGFISITNDVSVLLRAFLVDTTFGAQLPPAELEAPASNVAVDGAQGEEDPRKHTYPPAVVAHEPNGRKDNPRLRARLRALFGLTAIGLLVPIITNMVSGIMYKAVVNSGSHATLVQRLRIISAALTVSFLLLLMGCAAYSFLALRRASRWPPAFLVLICFLLLVIGIYRLAVLPNWTDSLLSTADGAQNLPRDKALFYVFHVAPEWLVEALLLSVNARRTFRTGMWGDAAANKPMPDVDKYIPFVRKASTN